MLELTPITFTEACAFIAQHHRHHAPSVGHKFSVAVSDGNTVRGVATIGRPVSRHQDDGWTLEVNRVATDGAKNACSMLYGAAWRAAKAMGYKRLITYTLPSESGASLRAGEWRCLGEAGGGTWHREARPRIDTEQQQLKLLWEIG